MLNKVHLIGRLTADIELRKTNEGTSFAYFTLAVNKRNNKDEADFISCVVWRETSENMAKYLSKGSQIFVEGRLDVYRTQQDGQYITRTNVNVQNVQFLDSKRGSSNNDSMSYDSEPKFNNTEAAAAKSIVEPDTSFEESKPTGNQEDINFDDIKF